MKASELILALEKIIFEAGDMEIKAALTPSTLYQEDKSVLNVEVIKNYIKIGK